MLYKNNKINGQIMNFKLKNFKGTKFSWDNEKYVKKYVKK